MRGRGRVVLVDNQYFIILPQYTFFPHQLAQRIFFRLLGFCASSHNFLPLTLVYQLHVCQLPVCHVVFFEFYVRLLLVKVFQLRIFFFACLPVCQLSILLAAYLGVPDEGVWQPMRKNVYYDDKHEHSFCSDDARDIYLGESYQGFTSECRRPKKG